jgi:Putative zinc-finger
MYGETKSDMQCAEFELLLTEALDGLLSPEKLSAFQAHAAACANCGVMLAEAESGLHWLESLPEIEPPSNLVRNIMVATVGVETARSAVPARVFTERLYDWVAPVLATFRQPRFAMSFGMAFFSISLLLSAAGVRLSDVRYIDLRPQTLVSKYYQTRNHVVTYYENIRFVYELETRVRELRRATTPETTPPETAPKNRKDNTSGEPGQEKYRNYSREEMQPTLAVFHGAPLAEAKWREL